MVMRGVRKLALYLSLLLLVLCIGKRIDVSVIALRLLFPNFVKTMVWQNTQLPITPKEVAEVEVLSSDVVREQLAEENRLSFESLLEEENSRQNVQDTAVQPVYTKEQLKDFEFLLNHIYNVDSGTAVSKEQLDADRLLAHDFHVDKKQEGPQILIYHTHSQEAFVDSIPGDEGTSIVGMGTYLTELLEKQGFSVLHHKEVFDMTDGVLDRNKAYTKAEPVITKLIQEHPTIQIVIDLHRDGVGENVHLVQEINGKPTAKVMFFNGMSYSAKNGAIDYLFNPHLEKNLALTMQMKLASDSSFPGFARKIYLKSLRFNLHLHPGAMLIEAGAQTNTVQEMRSAMEVLAQILSDVLY